MLQIFVWVECLNSVPLMGSGTPWNITVKDYLPVSEITLPLTANTSQYASV